MEFSRYQRPLGSFDARLQAITSEIDTGVRQTTSNTIRSLGHLPPQLARVQATIALPFLEMETYNGHVRTPADAIILFEACRLGLLPRVQRRLSEKERQSIKSGSVFVWDEREAGMRRWTDGKSWSASRVSGSFLTYREMEGKRGGNSFGPPLAAVSRAGKTPDSTRGSDSDLEMAGEDGPDGYRYKPDGLMKQSFSITTSSGNHLHLISYYSRANPFPSNLTSPTSDPSLRHIRPQKGMYPESTVHEHQNIPAVTRSPMANAPYSTVPQMAGYARQGPPQWSPHHYGYGNAWTPPPGMQPQQTQYGYQYNGSGGQYSGGPPPPTNSHSPLSHSQSAQSITPQPPDPNLGGYDQRRFPHMPGHVDHNIAAYDQNRSSQTPSDRFAQYPGIDPNMHIYDARAPTNQGQHPSMSPNNLTLPLQQHQRNNSPGNGVQSIQAQYRHPSPNVATSGHSAQQQLVQSANASSTPIDPRLMGLSPMMQQQTSTNTQSPHTMAPSPLMQQQAQSSARSRSPTPAVPKQESADGMPYQSNGTSQASTIPSIGAIMNNGSSGDHGNSPNADAKSDRSEDRTSGGSKKEKGPQDIPSDKLGFGEDMRALKVLDRAFKT